jgi:chromosome segregation ATPase
MNDFDINKITGNEPPLITEDDRDAEIERLERDLSVALEELDEEYRVVGKFMEEIERLRYEKAVLQETLKGTSISLGNEIERLREAVAYLRVLFQEAGAQRKADVAEIESLRWQLGQRGARMQKMLYWLCAWAQCSKLSDLYPETDDWFDEDGVPK